MGCNTICDEVSPIEYLTYALKIIAKQLDYFVLQIEHNQIDVKTTKIIAQTLS